MYLDPPNSWSETDNGSGIRLLAAWVHEADRLNRSFSHKINIDKRRALSE